LVIVADIVLIIIRCTREKHAGDITAICIVGVALVIFAAKIIPTRKHLLKVHTEALAGNPEGLSSPLIGELVTTLAWGHFTCILLLSTVLGFLFWSHWARRVRRPNLDQSSCLPALSVLFILFGDVAELILYS